MLSHLKFPHALATTDIAGKVLWAWIMTAQATAACVLLIFQQFKCSIVRKIKLSRHNFSIT